MLGWETAQPTTWMLHVDGSSNPKGAGAGIVLEGSGKFVVEQSLKFGFNTSNNQAEYEALLARLELAHDMGAEHLTCHNDSQLMVGQLNGEFQVKDALLAKYYHKAQAMLQKFEEVKVVHVKREHNGRADQLFKLASTRKRSCHKSVIQQLLAIPSVDRTSAETLTIEVRKEWFDPIKRFVQNGDYGEDDEHTLRMKNTRYVLIGKDLYRRGYSKPLLRCVTSEQIRYILEELHTGICGLHSGARSMANRVLRAGYYWPSIQTDCAEYVQKCRRCQKYGNLLHAQPEILHSITPPWPFAMWGMDIIGPFPLGKIQCKFLLVGVDYFTKWIEAGPLATITARKVQDFVWKNIIYRFGVPHTIVTNNGRQFVDKELANFYEGLNIRHVTSFVEHP